MKIFITGATGYIGHRLVQYAIDKGYSVHALVRDSLSQQLWLHERVRYFKGDITDYNSVVHAMKDCDAVIHSAGITQLWHPDRSIFYRVNVEGTKNVLEAACFHNVKKMVYTSTCGVLGPSLRHPVTEEDPRVTPFENDYEISKHCAEELVKEYSRRGLFAVIVAPTRVYGPGLLTNGNPVSKLIGNTIRRGIGFMPDAKQVLGNYVFIDDVAEGHFLALQKGLGGEKYILGGENRSYEEFFNGICKASPKKIRLITVPKFFLKLAGQMTCALSLLTRKHNHFTPKVVSRLYQHRAVNCQKAVKHLGYHITPFQVGLQQTIRFLKNENYV